MKVIELLNKIANDEELPEIIKVKGATYYLCGNDNSGQCYFTEKEGFGGFPLKFNTSQMNDEVEIIEEDKKIEKLKEYGTWTKDEIEKNATEMLVIKQKINEIIDKINKMEEGK